MKIKSIYIGGWFQRTMLQLSEIYDFLRDGTSQLNLKPEKLQALRDNLRIESIEYGVANEEFVGFVTENKIRVKLYEDGLIMVSNEQVAEDSMMADVEGLRTYYEEQLSPAINYLFSTGAPVFKELARVENIYPYFVVCDNASPEKLTELLAKTERQKYFEFDNKNYSVLRGDKFYFVNIKKAASDNIERYIEEQIFIREFKGQLHRYLNLHRAIWGKIDRIKKQDYLDDELLLADTAELERYEKTSVLVKGRLEQMATYLQVRAEAARDDVELAEFLAFSGYRYPALSGTLSYMQSLWETTRDYAKTARGFLLRAEQERVLGRLSTIMLLLGILVVVGILGLLFGTVLKFSVDTIIYGAILVVASIVVGQILHSLQKHKQYFMNNEERNNHEA